MEQFLNRLSEVVIRENLTITSSSLWIENYRVGQSEILPEILKDREMVAAKIEFSGEYKGDGCCTIV